MRKDNKKNIKMYIKNVCRNQKYTIKVYTNKNGIPTKYLRIKCTKYRAGNNGGCLKW